jgi:hypothetical protein
MAAGYSSASSLAIPSSRAGLRRVAVAQNAVDDLLPAVDLLIAQQRRAQHIRDSQVALVLFVERRQQADHFGVLALPQPAVGEQ